MVHLLTLPSMQFLEVNLRDSIILSGIRFYERNGFTEMMKTIESPLHMEVTLLRATIDNAKEIHAMQVDAFKELLQKYQDYDTNPGNESVEKVEARLKQRFTYCQNTNSKALRRGQFNYVKNCMETKTGNWTR